MKILQVILVIVVCAIWFCFGYRAAVVFNKSNTPGVSTIDTTVIHDTIEVPKPYPVKTYLTGEIIHDTLPGTHDSVPVVVDIPITAKIYQDSNYRAVVSGYRPSLDSLQIYRKTIIITKPYKVQPRWSVGLTGGYGATKDGLSPFVGIGITYNLFSLKVYL